MVVPVYFFSAAEKTAFQEIPVIAAILINEARTFFIAWYLQSPPTGSEERPYRHVGEVEIGAGREPNGAGSQRSKNSMSVVMTVVDE